MKIAILGYGLEGKSAEKYFLSKGHCVEVFERIDKTAWGGFDESNFDLILRSPGIRPKKGWSSITKYFFEHCPAKIIGVTGTKGKGTTCTMTAEILRKLDKNVHLLGNIGLPALDLLDEIKSDDLVVYEMSSFQLWDMEKSPEVAVILRIEPDHLDVHTDFDEYFEAKANIARYQNSQQTCIFYGLNEKSLEMARYGEARKIAYFSAEKINNQTEILALTKDEKYVINGKTGFGNSVVAKKIGSILDNLTVPGEHNRENALAAISAAAAVLNLEVADFVSKYADRIGQALAKFKCLPHHIELVRELSGVRYYDDSYSTSFPSLDVALKAFAGKPLVLIAGGKNKGFDLSPVVNVIWAQSGLLKAILIGETGRKIAEEYPDARFEFVEEFKDAIELAQKIAEDKVVSGSYDQCVSSGYHHQSTKQPVSVLLSPAASSFDMFESYKRRGEIFQEIVAELK